MEETWVTSVHLEDIEWCVEEMRVTSVHLEDIEWCVETWVTKYSSK